MSAQPHLGFGMDALLKARERDAQRAPLGSEERPARSAPEVPADAEIEEPWRTVHAWGGERFLPYDRWLPTAVCAITEPAAPTIHAAEDNIVGDCGDVRVMLVEDHGRWLMFVKTGKRKRATRRKDFASPFLAHAIQTAQAWYGVPSGGWRAEKKDGKQTADLPLQVSTLDEKVGIERGRDALVVDGQ